MQNTTNTKQLFGGAKKLPGLEKQTPDMCVDDENDSKTRPLTNFKRMDAIFKQERSKENFTVFEKCTSD